MIFDEQRAAEVQRMEARDEAEVQREAQQPQRPLWRQLGPDLVNVRPMFCQRPTRWPRPLWAA